MPRLFGYWNLVQFLLLPYEVREQERMIREDAEHSPHEADLDHEQSDRKWIMELSY